MKKLIIAFAVALLSSVNFAQAQSHEKMEHKQTPKHEASVHCYAMKDSAMMECWGKKGVPMSKDVTLKNGTKVTTTGEVIMMDGKQEKLKNGECILAKSGTLSAFNQAHPKHKVIKK